MVKLLLGSNRALPLVSLGRSSSAVKMLQGVSFAISLRYVLACSKTHTESFNC
jgi:hypothetical protein